MGAARRTATLLIASAVGFAAPITLYAAGSRYLEPTTPADAMPAYEILTRVRSLALDPIGEPQRRGSYYILQAYDRRGTEVRVVADAQFGDVISVTRASLVTPNYGPGTVGGARIIHVPAPGEESARVDPGEEPALEQAEPDEPMPSRPSARPRRPVRHVAKREPAVHRRPFSSAPPPPPPTERRAILNAPPPGVDDDPSPIRPTPRFTQDNAAEKFIMPPPVPPPPVPPPPGWPRSTTCLRWTWRPSGTPRPPGGAAWAARCSLRRCSGWRRALTTRASSRSCSGGRSAACSQSPPRPASGRSPPSAPGRTRP